MPTIDKLAWVLIQDRRVLYLRSKGKELFYNPGGKREGEETDIEALARELREELGVSIAPETASYLETFAAQADGKPEGTMVEIKCYVAEHTGTMAPTSEIEELAWFSSADGHRTTATGQLILDWLKKKDYID